MSLLYDGPRDSVLTRPPQHVDPLPPAKVPPQSPEPPAATTAYHKALRGWRSPLATLVTTLLLIQSVTGLWIYLAPFSLGSQIQVLLHVASGLVFVIPYAGYQLRHLQIWWRQKLTAVMVLGYLLKVMVITCVASGLVLTWQGAFGLKISRTWDLVHIVGGLAAFALLGAHLVLAWLRRPATVRQADPLRKSAGRFAMKACAGLVIAPVLLVAAALWPVREIEFAAPTDYSLSKYIEKYDEYRGNPFAPSYARTENRTLVDPGVFTNSTACGSAGCHEQILAEWEPSAHRFSAMNPPFQAVQKDFAQDREPAETRYCAGCHDPISLFAGAKDIHNLDLSSPGTQEGASCALCHSISKVDQRGNADYVVTVPRKYLWEDAQGLRKAISDFLIRTYPRQHLADYNRPLLRTAELCGACHKQFIPEALNRFGLVASQNQYDEWRASHWHVDDPDKNLSCIDCHMRLVRDSRDPGRGERAAVRRSPDDGAHRHHGMIATNVFMPQILKLPHWQQQVRLTEQWIGGETVIHEIEHLWPAGPVASVKLFAPRSAAPGSEVQVQAVVVNRKAGHNLITGPLDFMRCWIHVTVTDAQGREIAAWGAIDPATRWIMDSPGQKHQIGNSRKEGTLVLEGAPVDSSGELLVRHELWKMAGGKGKRVIFPGHSDHQRFHFQVPSWAQGPLLVKADLNFRRYRQQFLDLVVPQMERERGVYQPTVRQAHDAIQISLDAPEERSMDKL